MMRVGFVGWRGMVGSVLIQRMLEENDFEHLDPVFFSTSSAGGRGPSIGRATGALRNAHDANAFEGLDAIVTCQGGDWTKPMYSTIRGAGWVSRRFDEKEPAPTIAWHARISSRCILRTQIDC